jgi:hypothetical protein
MAVLSLFAADTGCPSGPVFGRERLPLYLMEPSMYLLELILFLVELFLYLAELCQYLLELYMYLLELLYKKRSCISLRNNKIYKSYK